MMQMPIWSLTAERLKKLTDAIASKKAEYDELLAMSEKDLWCRDLDDFAEEWENQMKIDADIQTNIRRMGRRVSKKIGAGRTRKPKDEDAWEPEKKAKAKAKVKAPPVRTETKSAERFAEMFSAKPKKEPKEETAGLSDGFSDDDFAALGKSKPAAKPSESRAVSTSLSQPAEPEPPRDKRTAASKAKTLFEVDSDSDEDEDKMLGDVGDLVKGIGKTSGESSGRLSLHAMSRPESSHDRSSSGGLSKTKSKSSKTFDVDSPDETNYEMLAKSSPYKTATKSNDIDSFLSDDEPAPPPPKKATSKSSSAAAAPAVKKARGRPAGAKNKAKDEPASKAKVAPKKTALSPAAKAYAAKKALKKSAVEDSDDDMAEPDSPPPKPAARGRPGRAAAARKPVVVDDDSSMALDDEDESDDPFDMDDDD